MATQRILIVDDQHDARRVLATGIRTLRAELEVVDIPSGEEALLDISRRPVDLLVTDVRLPGMSGFELVTRLKKRNPTAKVILVTGVDDARIRRQVADAEADAFFYKPVHMADFLDTVERCLGLTQTAFTPKPVAPEPAAPNAAAPSPAELIGDLRHTLGAVAVILMDIVGQSEAQAGDVPADLGDLIPLVISALATSTKLSHALKAGKPEGFWYLKSDTVNLCITHLGKSHAVLIISKNPLQAEHFKAIELFTQQLDLDVQALMLPSDESPETVETVTLPPMEEIPFAELSAEEIPALEALFAQADQLKNQDLDSFWDSAADAGKLEGVFTAKTITFDQAIKLGLAPDEDQKKKE